MFEVSSVMCVFCGKCVFSVFEFPFFYMFSFVFLYARKDKLIVVCGTFGQSIFTIF